MIRSRFAFFVAGALSGLTLGAIFSRVWSPLPVHAVATHGHDNFAIATGPVDEDSEAIFFLDFLTGELKASVLNSKTKKFNAAYVYNVARDLLQPNVKNPRYLMVTGVSHLGGGQQNVVLGNSVVYVAEATSGQLAAYGIPWNPSRQAMGVPQGGAFIPLDLIRVRNVPIRETE